jgi:putative chitinase
VITEQHLLAAGVKNPGEWLAAIQSACEEFKINTPKQIAAFIAQTAHESAGYTRLTENLNYSAEALMRVWPKRFPSKIVADAFARNPELIANQVYSSRMGNGPVQSGDGWKFIGRGLKQLTGKDNYTRCGNALGFNLVENPELLLLHAGAARSAGWFWSINGCAALADAGQFEQLTKRINGGLIGLADRKARYDRVLAIGN